MPEEKVPRLVRFDFPPGASPAEIARAIQEARERLMAERAAEKEKKPDDAR